MNNLNQNIGEDSVVIFVHIPKTAGTTLRHIIQSQFKPNNVFEFYYLKAQPSRVPQGIEKYNNLSEAQKKAIEFVSGHAGFGLHEFIPRPCTYITVLRNPVERVVSYYYSLLRNKNKIVENKTLEDFIQTYGRVHNEMTCFLSGLTLKAQLQDPSIDVKAKQFDRETLEIAKNNLKKHYAVFGFVERFDETCILLKRILGWNISPLYVRKNVSKQQNWTDNLPKHTLNLIEKFNELDFQLYDYAQEMFEELINQQGTSFKREVEEFKQANQSSTAQLYSKVHCFYNRVEHRIYQEIVSRS